MHAARRHFLVATMSEVRPLQEVVEAITALGKDPFARVYVERHAAGYRWSIAHRGGAYPLLREIAQLLEVRHTSVAVPFRTIDGWTVLWPQNIPTEEVEAWAVIEGGSDADDVMRRVLLAVGPVAGQDDLH